MNIFSALRAAPPPAVVLGFAGLIPFVGLAGTETPPHAISEPHAPLPDRHAQHGRPAFLQVSDVYLRAQ